MNTYKESDVRESVASAKREKDFGDLQNEVAGREVGRIARFLPEDVRNPEQTEKRKAERTEMLTRLQLMMQDKEYAALYRETMNHLAEAERATETALAKALERQRVADEALADTRARALKLEDGRNVYRDENGTFRTEDGLSVSDTDMDAITEQWHPGMPGYQDFIEKRDASQAEAAIVGEIRTYQTDVLGAARDRLQDNDDPPSKEGFEAINERIAGDMPEQVRRELRGQEKVLASPSPSATMDVPKL